MDVPDVRYARSGDVAIAYQVVGDGEKDLVLSPFLANIWSLWTLYGFEEFGLKLARERRLIVVNPRGVGLSDRPRGFTIESRMDDIRAVMDAVGSERSDPRNCRVGCDVRGVRGVLPGPSRQAPALHAVCAGRRR